MLSIILTEFNMSTANNTRKSVSKVIVHHTSIKVTSTNALIVLLLLLPASVQSKPYCSVLPAQIGQDSVLTCHFDENVSNLKQRFKVEHHFQKQNSAFISETVIDCSWEKGYDNPHCYNRQGYALKGTISNTAEVIISSASYQNVGNYSCSLAPFAEGSFTFCNFTLPGINTTCDITVAEPEEKSLLRCNFSDDISKLQDDVAVVRYSFKDFDNPVNVLSCLWKNGVSECKSNSGDTPVDSSSSSNTLQVRLPDPRQDISGRYRCTLSPFYQGSYGLCSLILKAENISTVNKTAGVGHINSQPSDEEGSGFSLHVVIIVVVIILAAALIISIAVFVRCRKKTEIPTVPEIPKEIQEHLLRVEETSITALREISRIEHKQSMPDNSGNNSAAIPILSLNGEVSSNDFNESTA